MGLGRKKWIELQQIYQWTKYHTMALYIDTKKTRLSTSMSNRLFDRGKLSSTSALWSNGGICFVLSWASTTVSLSSLNRRKIELGHILDKHIRWKSLRSKDLIFYHFFCQFLPFARSEWNKKQNYHFCSFRWNNKT